MIIESNNDKVSTTALSFAKQMLSNMPLWTMLAEIPRNRGKYHIATDDWKTFCGKTNMVVRDRIVFENGNLYYTAMGLGQKIKDKLDDSRICKKCLHSMYSRYGVSLGEGQK